jgi:hypothetical protein
LRGQQSGGKEREEDLSRFVELRRRLMMMGDFVIDAREWLFVLRCCHHQKSVFYH